MKNYYFKFGYGNDLFHHFHNRGKESIDVGDLVELAIFFHNKDNDWGAEDVYDNEKRYKIGQSKSSIEQIETFFNCPFTEEPSYLWIYDKGEIFVFKPIRNEKPITQKTDKFSDYPKYKDKYKQERPKSLKAKLHNKFDWKEVSKLPERFATLNANQSFNRKTIKEMDSSSIEGRIAQHLIENKTMEINYEERLNYLSPIQFETLIFLIFHHRDCFVSSFRGGTRKDIDLVVQPKIRDFGRFKQEKNYNIQLKMLEVNKPKMMDVDCLIHLGKSNIDEGILGMDWIEENIQQEKVDNWLNESLSFFHIEE